LRQRSFTPGHDRRDRAGVLCRTIGHAGISVLLSALALHCMVSALAAACATAAVCGQWMHRRIDPRSRLRHSGSKFKETDSMAEPQTNNSGTVFFWSLVLCLGLAVIVYVLG
jgi:hypothetical protein